MYSFENVFVDTENYNNITQPIPQLYVTLALLRRLLYITTIFSTWASAGYTLNFMVLETKFRFLRFDFHIAIFPNTQKILVRLHDNRYIFSVLFP